MSAIQVKANPAITSIQQYSAGVRDGTRHVLAKPMR
jgi:hypothetical protein